MLELFTSNNFLVAASTVAAIGMGIFVKIVTRNDTHKFFSRNDFAVGFDLMISAIIILTGRLNTNSPWLLLVIVFLLWGVSTLVRKKGWTHENHLKIIIGVLIPNFIGLGVLVFIVFNT